MRLKERMMGFLPRLEKAQALLEGGKVHPVLGKDGLFVVESQEGKGHYLVDLEGETCICPAFAQGKSRPCKHLIKHLIAAVLHEYEREKALRERGRAAQAARAVA
jgi:predicted nucleic acid-binding Zn finger protein